MLSYNLDHSYSARTAREGITLLAAKRPDLLRQAAASGFPMGFRQWIWTVPQPCGCLIGEIALVIDRQRTVEEAETTIHCDVPLEIVERATGIDVVEIEAIGIAVGEVERQLSEYAFYDRDDGPEWAKQQTREWVLTLIEEALA